MLSDGVVGLFLRYSVDDDGLMLTRINPGISFVVKGAGKNLFCFSRDFRVIVTSNLHYPELFFMTWRPIIKAYPLSLKGLDTLICFHSLHLVCVVRVTPTLPYPSFGKSQILPSAKLICQVKQIGFSNATLLGLGKFELVAHMSQILVPGPVCPFTFVATDANIFEYQYKYF